MKAPLQADLRRAIQVAVGTAPTQSDVRARFKLALAWLKGDCFAYTHALVLALNFPRVSLGVVFELPHNRRAFAR